MKRGKYATKRFIGYSIHFLTVIIFCLCIGSAINTHGISYLISAVINDDYVDTIAFRNQYRKDMLGIREYINLRDVVASDKLEDSQVMLYIKLENSNEFYGLTVGDIKNIVGENQDLDQFLAKKGGVTEKGVAFYAFFDYYGAYPFGNIEYVYTYEYIRDKIQLYLDDISKETQEEIIYSEYIYDELDSTVTSYEVLPTTGVAATTDKDLNRILEESRGLVAEKIELPDSYTYVVNEQTVQYIDTDSLQTIVEYYYYNLFPYIDSAIKWKEELSNSNLALYFVDGETVISNLNNTSIFDSLQFKELYQSCVLYENEQLLEDSGYLASSIIGRYPNSVDKLYIGIDKEFSFDDEYSEGNEEYIAYKKRINAMIPVLIGTGIIWLGSLVYLIVIAGKDENGEIVLRRGDKRNSELTFILYMTVMGVLILGIIGLLKMFWNLGVYDYYNIDMIGEYYIYGERYRLYPVVRFCMAFTLLPLYIVLLSYVMRIVRRRKAHITYWDTSILKKIIAFLIQVYNNGSITVKTMFLFGVYMFVNVVAFSMESVFLLIIIQVVTITILLIKAVGRNQIGKGLELIAKGNVDYQIDTSHMIGEEKKLAEKINILKDGLKEAVNKSVKDERLRSELITNVSHDIKTPLTSIINYVDLIKREQVDNEVVRKYIEVLDNKSQRLKHLIDDLVEVSKVNSGNITLDITTLDFMELVKQTLGEFEEKFEQKGLLVVPKLLDTQAMIEADGRRVWRIFENLFNNIYKYGMPNTRVYIDSFSKGGWVGVVIKNISEHSLNISASELTERFVRGDVSRTTEGSGLGLSIAKSLAEIMGGQLIIYLDGDLFRVTVVFPLKEERKDTKKQGQAVVQNEYMQSEKMQEEKVEKDITNEKDFFMDEKQNKENE